MAPKLWVAAAVAGASSVYRSARRWLHPPSTAPVVATALDPSDVRGAVALVCTIEVCHATRRRRGADELATCLVGLFRTFEPRETSLRALSLAQQRLEGSGGVAEFCCCLVYSAMITAIAEGSCRGASAQRTDVNANPRGSARASWAPRSA